MTSRERCIKLIEDLPEYKLGYILAYLQGLSVDEDADDAFCKSLYEDYKRDTDPAKAEPLSLDDCKREWGLI